MTSIVANMITNISASVLISLNMVILLIPYVSLEITKALDYYFYVTSCTFSIVWSSFYTLNILRSNGIKGQITEELQVKHYTQSGIAGRSTSGGITCEYKGDALHLSTTRESEKLYKIYGDSVISHIKVRLALKETLPYVYYVDDALITYSEFYLKYIFGHPFSSSNTRKDGIPE